MSFNLLSEILFVQAVPFYAADGALYLFQSLERDSVCSSICPMVGAILLAVVSIS